MEKIRVECCLSHVCCLRDTTLGGNTMIQKEKEQVDQTALCLAEVEWPCCFKKHTKEKKNFNEKHCVIIKNGQCSSKTYN